MARLHLALLLLFVTISAVIVSAADRPPSVTTAEAPGASASTDGDVDVAEGPADDNAIGTTDDDGAATPGDDDVAVPGPIGSDASYANYPPPQQASGSSSSAVAFGSAFVVAATAGLLFLF